MRLLVFGATGATGRQLVSQALEQDHEVTAFVRRPEALVPRQGLRVVRGDTRDRASVEAAVAGHDAALSALGIGMSLMPGTLIADSMRNIVPALERAGVRRFVLMSAFGVGATRNDAPPLLRLMYGTLLAGIFADKRDGEDIVRASALEWTIVYPVVLTGGPLTARYRASERLELSGLPTIARADVAHFMLAEAAERRYVRKGVVIAT